MAVQFKMPFTVINWTLGRMTELGSVDETLWSLVPSSFDSSGILQVDIFRSRSDDKVKIDVRVYNNGFNLLSINDFFLSEGVKNIGFPFSGNCFSVTSIFKGIVTVHYNLKNTLTSKKEVVTQTKHSIISSIAEKIIPSPQLVSDLLHLLDNPESFSDATLVCGAAKIPVHRNILSARSPVFSAMFKTQMQEGRDGVVDIVDMEPDVLKAMLKYVYSGKTDHLTCSLAGDLLFAADKYQLEELKLICVEELKVSMTASNVFRSLVLGDLHDSSLKSCAVKFICKCKDFSDLEKSEDWQSLLKDRPYLAVELLTTVVKCLQKK